MFTGRGEQGKHQPLMQGMPHLGFNYSMFEEILFDTAR